MIARLELVLLAIRAIHAPVETWVDSRTRFLACQRVILTQRQLQVRQQRRTLHYSIQLRNQLQQPAPTTSKFQTERFLRHQVLHLGRVQLGRVQDTTLQFQRLNLRYRKSVLCKTSIHMSRSDLSLTESTSRVLEETTRRVL